MKTVIFNAHILPKAERKAFISHGFIEIDGTQIRRIGKGDWDKSWNEPDINLFDASNKLVIPGLFNAHTHLAMTLFKGLGEDLPLLDWLQKYIFPLEAKWVKSETVLLGAKLAAIECIRCGVTSVGDMYYFGNETAKALDEAGLRGWIGQATTSGNMPDAKNLDEGLKHLETLIKAYEGNDRITPTAAPHSTYSENIDTLKTVAEFARTHNLITQIHVSESQAEQNMVAEKHKGQTPTEVLRESGFAEIPMVLAHGVYLSDSDLALLKTFKHAAVVYNPESNMKLGSGIAPIPEILEAGITLALGTDGSASNNDIDLLTEMDTASKLQKTKLLDATAFSTEAVFRAATLGGAEAFQVGEQLGTLEVGKKADLAFLDLRSPHMVPMHDALSNIVFCAKTGDTTDLMVNGEWVMRNRVIETLDEYKIIEEAVKLGMHILEDFRG